MLAVTFRTFSTHVQSPAEELERLRITGSMVRLSIGLESPADLCADLDQALRAACGPTPENGRQGSVQKAE